MKNLEHTEQTALIKWCALNGQKHPELALMFAICNAAKLTPRQGAWMKAEGKKAGVPDLFLPVSRGTHHGLFIEMKEPSGKNKPTTLQLWWHEKLRKQGYSVEVCYGWEAAVKVIKDYLK